MPHRRYVRVKYVRCFCQIPTNLCQTLLRLLCRNKLILAVETFVCRHNRKWTECYCTQVALYVSFGWSSC